MSYQRKSNIYFGGLAKNQNIKPTEKVGRYLSHAGLEKNIFKDIIHKLNLEKGDKFLDIGCGCGPLVDKLIKFCHNKKIDIKLCDIPEVLLILKKKYSKLSNINFIEGEFQKKKINKKYNKILCYSVIQYSDNPKKFFKIILNKLSKNGKALIGDIPNINKKYRFLKSNFGKLFEENRIKKKIKLKNFKNYINSGNHNILINDIFIQYIFNYCRKNKRSCLILKQPIELPFSFTREDVLIEEY